MVYEMLFVAQYLVHEVLHRTVRVNVVGRCSSNCRGGSDAGCSGGSCSGRSSRRDISDGRLRSNGTGRSDGGGSGRRRTGFGDARGGEDGTIPRLVCTGGLGVFAASQHVLQVVDVLYMASLASSQALKPHQTDRGGR